jgi:hypothetical protein
MGGRSARLLPVPNEEELGESHSMFGRAVNGKLSLLLPETTMIIQPLFNYRIVTELPSKQEVAVPPRVHKKSI